MKKILFATAKAVAVCAVLFVGAAVGSAFLFRSSEADAARSASGTYSKLYTFSSGSVINSSNMNSQMSDLETEMTDSLSRSGKGAMLAPLRATNGTSVAPSLTFDSETTAGLFRNGSGDIRMTFNGTSSEQWASTGVTIPGNLTLSGNSSVLSLTGTTAARLGVGGAPSDPFDVIQPGTASTVLGSFTEALLSDGNFVQLAVGKAQGNNTAAYITYTKSATAANSTACLGVGGSTSALCTDGNNTTKIGTSGTALTNVVWATCTTSASSTCTATVQSGATCMCSQAGGTGANACNATVSGTTLTCSFSAVGIWVCRALCIN